MLRCEYQDLNVINYGASNCIILILHQLAKVNVIPVRAINEENLLNKLFEEKKQTPTMLEDKPVRLNIRVKIQSNIIKVRTSFEDF